MNYELPHERNQQNQSQRDDDIEAIRRGIEDEKAGRVISFEQFDERLRSEVDFKSSE